MPRSKRWIFGFILLVGTTLLPATTHANGLSVSPAIKNLILQQDQPSTTFEFTVANNTEETTVLRLATLDFGSLDESGGVAFIAKTSDGLSTKYGLSNWLRFTKDSLVLEPGKVETMTAFVDNKESLSPGGHYGAIIATPVVINSDGTESKVSINPSLSVLVFLNKQGGENYSLGLEDPVLPSLSWRLPGELELRFQNAGNVHVVPRGFITIQDFRGRTVAKGTINVDSAAMLPETFRRFKTEVRALEGAWLPGKYKAEVSWRYEGSDDIQKNVVEFYFLGKLLYLIAGIIIIFLICYVAFRTTRRKKVFHRRG